MRLFDFYEMPWCEYLIKREAYYRVDRELWRKFRLVGFSALIGSHYDSRRLPRDEDAYLPLGGKARRRASKESLEKLKKEQDEFYRKDNSRHIQLPAGD